MNWEAIGAIGEIAGALGVVLTLVYLSVQLRQNTKAMQITAIQNTMENSAHFSELLSTDDDLADVFWLGLEDPGALDANQMKKFINALNVFLRRESVAFYLNREGTMPDHLWVARVAALTGPLNQPGLRMYLDVAGETLPSDFFEFLEEVSSHDSTMSEEMKSMVSSHGDA